MKNLRSSYEKNAVEPMKKLRFYHRSYEKNAVSRIGFDLAIM